MVFGSKQNEPLQQTPQSVFVATAPMLDLAQINDFEDLPRLVPSLTITKTSQPANNSINIRGVGTYAYSIATESSVAVVIDDIPQAMQAAAFTTLSDIQQVEILRGPQSTLFGKSASAGVINIRTRPASPTFAGRLEAMQTDDGEERYQASISGPLTSNFRARLSGAYSDYRGTVFNLGTGHWLNGQQDTVLRGKLEWRPQDRVTVTLSPFSIRSVGTCCAAAETFVPPGSTTGAAATGPTRIPPSEFLNGITPSRGNRLMRMDVDARGDARDDGAGLRVEIERGGYRLMSISSYDSYHLDDLQDTDSTDIDFSRYQPQSPPGGSANGGDFDVYATTQEFRLNSPDDGRLRYVAGAFFSDTRSRRYFVRGSNTLDDYNIATPAGSPGAPASPSSLPTTNGTTYSRYLAHSRATNYALFGQGAYSLDRRLDLLAGLRLNREEISYKFFDLNNGVTFGDPACSQATPSGTPISTCDEDTAITGRLGVRYAIAPDHMAFAAYSRGYKGMAYDLTSTLASRGPAPATSPYPGRPLGDVVAAKQPVPAETVDNWEIGYKGSFLNNQVQLNVTAFYATYEGFQAQSRDLLLNQNLLNSIGQVTSRGLETELMAHLGALTLNGAATYNRAIMDNFPNASCYRGQTIAEGCIDGQQDLSGKPLFSAPEWSANFFATYDFPVSATLSGFVSGGYTWQSEVVFNLLQDPASVQPGYGVARLSAGLFSDHWRFTGFVSNLFDQRFSLTAGRDAHINNPPGEFATSWKPGRESSRYVGARLSYNF